MEIYGYEREGDELLELEEVSLKISAHELDDLIDFLKLTCELMKKHGDDFGHEHFKDWLLKKQKKIHKTDIIVVA